MIEAFFGAWSERYTDCDRGSKAGQFPGVTDLAEETCRRADAGVGDDWSVDLAARMLSCVDGWLADAEKDGDVSVPRLKRAWDALYETVARRADPARLAGLPPDASRPLRLLALSGAGPWQKIMRSDRDARLVREDRALVERWLPAELRAAYLCDRYVEDPEANAGARPEIEAGFSRLLCQSRERYLDLLTRRTTEERKSFVAAMAGLTGENREALVHLLSQRDWPEAVPMLEAALSSLGPDPESPPHWYDDVLEKLVKRDPARWGRRFMARSRVYRPEKVAEFLHALEQAGEPLTPEEWEALAASGLPVEGASVWSALSALMLRYRGEETDALRKRALDGSVRPFQRVAALGVLYRRNEGLQDLESWRRRLGSSDAAEREAVATLLALRGEAAAWDRLMDVDPLGDDALRDRLPALVLVLHEVPGCVRRVPARILVRAAAPSKGAAWKSFLDEVGRRATDPQEWRGLLEALETAWPDDDERRGGLLSGLPLAEAEPLCRAVVCRVWDGPWPFAPKVACALQKGGRSILDWLGAWAVGDAGRSDALGESLAKASVRALVSIGTLEAFDILERLAAGGPSSVVAEVAARIGRPDGTPEEARRWFDYRLSRGRIGEVEAALGGPRGAAAAAALFNRWPDVYRCRDAGATRVYIPE